MLLLLPVPQAYLRERGGGTGRGMEAGCTREDKTKLPKNMRRGKEREIPLERGEERIVRMRRGELGNEKKIVRGKDANVIEGER